LPLDAPEHWLARLGELRVRGAAGDATKAAELAWLHGAGELAVLLDAGLQVFSGSGESRALALQDAAAANVLARRVGAADARDTPAAAPLQALLSLALGATAPDLDALRRFPPARRVAAGSSFVATAQATPQHRAALLQMAAALGSAVDFGTAPWCDVPSDSRAAIEAEAQRAR
jgi:hypothetical protein